MTSYASLGGRLPEFKFSPGYYLYEREQITSL